MPATLYKNYTTSIENLAKPKPMPEGASEEYNVSSFLPGVPGHGAFGRIL